MTRTPVSNHTRMIAVTGMLLAVQLLFVFTPIGYLPIPPINPSTMCIPVLLGMMVEGLPVGIFLGFVFGLTSFLRGIFGLSLYVFQNPLISIVPRMLIPVTPWIIMHFLSGLTRRGKLGEAVSMAVASFAGSATNTLLVLPLIALIYGTDMGRPIGVIMLTNGLPEAITAAIVVPAIVSALQRAGLRRYDPTENIIKSIRSRRALATESRHDT